MVESKTTGLKKLKGLGGNKKFLLKEYGYKSIQEAEKDLGLSRKNTYDYLLTDYNETIEKINLEELKKKMTQKKEQKKKDKMMKKENKLTEVLNDIKNGKIQKHKFKAIDLIKNYKNKKEAITDLLKKINSILGDKNIDIIINGKIYSINSYTSKRLYELIQKEGISELNNQGSDAEVIYNLSKPSSNFTIQVFNPTNKKNKYSGAFFPYTHNINFDFSDYQIYNSIQKEYENCLLHALFIGGISKSELQPIKLSCNADDIPICELNNICDKLKIKILLKREKKVNDNKTHSYITTFGKDYEEEYKIGLLEGHYFIIGDTGITRFAVENYDELKLQRTTNCNWNYICKRKGIYYEKDENRTIDSWDLIKILLNNKEKFLKQINKNDIYHTQFYNKIDNEIFDLNYTPMENINYRMIEVKGNKGKPSKKITKNIYFDFETNVNKETNEDEETDLIHKPYLCCFIDDEGYEKSFIGLDCGIQMLKYIYSKFDYNDYKIRLIAHNSSYDIKFILKYLTDINEIARGTSILSCKAKFNKLEIEIKDSYLLISMPLKKFSKTFNISGAVKEVISYDMYNNTDCLKRVNIPIEEGLYWIRKNKLDEKQFLENLDKWNLKFEEHFDCVEYSRRYCEIDCRILKQGYETFRNWMNELTNINIDETLTIASLAHKYFIMNGCYEDVNEIGGIPQNFIQKCVVGGRVMCSDNKKMKMVDTVINDFDAVSLYPSAMKRMEGFLIGLPKVITDLNYETIKDYDGYFVEIKIKDVGIKRKFPLMSYVNDDGIRNFTNDMIGKNMYVDKTTLEDLIEYQEIEFDIIRGYYFDEGHNKTINSVIEKIFNERLKLKKEGNPAEMVYKLIMNSGYGKSIMKPVENEIKYFNSKEEMEVFKSRNYNWVVDTEPVKESNIWRIKLVKPINDHFNIAHIGVCILSESKRIMNEVMCLAEDIGIDLYYQDTDSIHLQNKDIEELSSSFKQIYNRELIGKSLGQFHSDFELESCENVVAKRSIFLGKKCYIDELVGTDENGKEKIGHHIRMKGVPNSCVLYTAKKENCDVFELYEKLYNGEKIMFDLTEGGNKDNFKYHTNSSVETLVDFKREICFV